MKDLFNIKRTKMIDDAAFRHAPRTPGKTVLSFILFYFVANFLCSIITFAVDLGYNLYTFIKSGLMSEYYDATKSQNAEALEEVLDKMLELTSIPWWFVCVELFASALIIGACIFFCIKFEKRPVPSLGIRKKGVLVELILGVLVGAAIVFSTVGFTFITGSLGFEPYKPFSTVFVVLIFACLIDAFANELLFHGVLMASLARDTKPIFAILITSILYAAFHALSLNIFIIINSFLLSFLLGLYVFKRGSIWGATIISFVWTYVSSVIFGSPLMSLMEAPSILLPNYKFADIISGGDVYGINAGVAFTLVLVVAIFVLLLTKTKKSELSQFEIEYFN